MQIEVLGERYQLQDPIGRGGMATIYRGRDMRMDRTVAIKVLREVYSTDPKFVTRFQREAKAASSLQHPNIVQVYDYGQSDGNYFIVMELVEGTDLRRYLRSRGVLAIDRAIIIAHDVAFGLGAAHRRSIVHRDVKPQNVLVGRDGSIKLTDFGIASVYKDINDERLTTTGMTLGTVQYYAPEQAQGEIVSPAADVYALGIVMYEMLTGRTPFDGDTPVAVAMQHIQDAPLPPSQLNPNIPPALEEIILRCLEKVPEMRFRDGNVLARALEMLGEDNQAALSPANLSSPNGPQTPAHGNPHYMANTGMGGTAFAHNGAANGAEKSMLPPEQSYGGAAVSPSDSTVAMPQQGAPQPPAQGTFMNNSGATKPFRRDDLGKGGDAALDRRDARLAGIVAVALLVATVLLLGFSVYLAGLLGFLPFSSTNASSTPTVTNQLVDVPNLTGLSYEEAKKRAEDNGFKIDSGRKSGTVIEQNPKSGTKKAKGSSILVRLELKMPDLRDKSLKDAQKELRKLGVAFTIVENAARPTDTTLEPNTVTETDPVAGTVLGDNEKVTLLVTNYNQQTVPTVEPTPTTGPKSTPTQAPAPTPTPTQPPAATPTPAPTPTPTQPPAATPTPGVTPTPVTKITPKALPGLQNG